MKVLITGISSSLGILIARRLSKNHEIIGISTRTLKEFKTIKFDLGSDKSLMIEPVDVCIHLAFITDANKCENDPYAYKVNILGTKNVLNYCKRNKVKKFILGSTGGVYGFSKKLLKENMEAHPYNAYASMKYQAEQMAKKYSSYFDVVVLRYFFPYGPETKEDSLINNLINNVRKGKKIILHKDGKPAINPIFVEELVEATSLFCLKKFKGFNIFNIAGPEKASIKEIILMISSIIGKGPVFEPSGKVFGDMVGDINKLQDYHKPKIGLRQGLKITINNLKQNELKK